VNTRSNVAERHQVLTIGADVHLVMINRILVPTDGPLQRVRTQTWAERKAVVDSGFELRGFFIVIPGYKLEIWQRLA